MLALTHAHVSFAENPHRITRTACLGGHMVLGAQVTSVRLLPSTIAPVYVPSISMPEPAEGLAEQDASANAEATEMLALLGSP